MDRFALSDRDKELTYGDALQFLGEIRAGISWNRFTTLSIRYFDLFMDILNNTDAARKYLEESHLDRDYIVNRIREVLFKLHFNRDNNHYLTLCLPNNVPEEEIHRRWRDLMLIYHPDRNSNDDSALECAKKINESYSILKDNYRRSLYNSELIRKTLAVKSNSRKREIRKGIFSPRLQRIIPKVIKVSYFIIPAVVLIMIFVDRRSQVFDLYEYRRPENQKKTPHMTDIDRTVSGQTGDMRYGKSNSGLSQGQDKETKRENKLPLYDSKGSPSSSPAPVMPRAEPLPEHGITEKEPVTNKTGASDIQNINIAEDRRDGKDSVILPSTNKDINISPTVRGETESNISPIAKREVSHQDIAVNLTEGVNTFLSQYRHAYEKGQIEEFLSLYSKTAIENGMPFDGIKRAYERYFDSDRYNSIEFDSIQVKEKDSNIIITGRYRLYKRRENSVLAFKEGNIRWILIRNGEQLKIIRSEYDRN